MAVVVPPLEIIALNRLAFGPSPADFRAIQQQGFKGWVESQLKPDDAADQACARRLAAATLRIKYDANPQTPDYPALDQARPLTSLDQPIDQVWHLLDPKRPAPNQEKGRPRVEVAAATLLRAVYSRWQLREVLCDFWHNHFNVNAFDQAVGIALPSYDRDVIRRHCLGNFREFLEAVATSTAMLYYLNNRSSRAGNANENFGRELFELHTLGRASYLNDLYDHWRDVPGAPQGHPSGYIDQDVYESARAFTGWTVEDGSDIGGGQHLPASGRFAYVEGWHDGYQKRVLGTEFDPFQAPMTDGRKVLDLLAAHPATARYVCAKLCRRLVSDQPSDALVAAAAEVWTKNRTKPDQIRQVVRAIVLSPEFARSWGDKVKRPLEVATAYLRTTGIEFTPTEGLINEIGASGQRLFGWPTPDGHPDLREDWLGTNAMRRRWSLVMGITDNAWGTGAFNPAQPFGGGPITAGRALDHWLPGVLGYRPSGDLAPTILRAARLAPQDPLAPPGKDPAPALRHLVAYCAMAPEFHLR